MVNQLHLSITFRQPGGAVPLLPRPLTCVLLPEIALGERSKATEGCNFGARRCGTRRYLAAAAAAWRRAPSESSKNSRGGAPRCRGRFEPSGLADRLSSPGCPEVESKSPPSGSRHRSVARRANSYCSQAIATRLRWQWRAEARSVEGGEKGSENQRWTRESRAEESGESARQIPARRLLTTREGIFAFSVVWGGGLDQQLRRRRPAMQSAAVSVSRSGRSRWHCRNRKHTATGRKGQRWSPAQREHPNDALLGPSLWLWLETPKRWSAVRSKAVPSLIQSWSHHSQILVLYVFSLCLACRVPVSSSAPRVSQVSSRFQEAVCAAGAMAPFTLLPCSTCIVWWQVLHQQVCIVISTSLEHSDRRALSFDILDGGPFLASIANDRLANLLASPRGALLFTFMCWPVLGKTVVSLKANFMRYVQNCHPCGVGHGQQLNSP